MTSSPRNERRPRILLVVTHPMTARLLMRGQLADLAGAGYEVAVASAPGRELDEVAEVEGVATFAVPFRREIAPLADLAALVQLVRVVRRFRPDLVHASTPKAGLLGMLAARLLCVPARLYTVRGLRLETLSGLRRAILAATEQVAIACAQRVVCVSTSLRERVVELGLAPRAKTVVHDAGSSNGVDVERFHPRWRDDPENRRARAELGLGEGAPVVGFVGRFTRDKGIEDLAEAFFDVVLPRFPEARLLLLGDFEAGNPVPVAVAERLRGDPRVLRPGFVGDTAPYYAWMNVLAFPTYREGFPNAPLEASSSGVAVAGYVATGTVDAVAEGETGTLVPVGDRVGLGEALARYLGDPELARRHGAAGRARVENHFRQERVWRAWRDEYERLLRAAGRGGPGSLGTSEVE